MFPPFAVNQQLFAVTAALKSESKRFKGPLFLFRPHGQTTARFVLGDPFTEIRVTWTIFFSGVFAFSDGTCGQILWGAQGLLFCFLMERVRAGMREGDGRDTKERLQARSSGYPPDPDPES